MVENETHEGDPYGPDKNTEAHITAPTPERVKEEGQAKEGQADDGDDSGSDYDRQDETERETFPASDPQSSWAGPADPRDR